MSIYLLVHGSWHGAWCWHKIVPRLQTHGHKAIAIDLPGHGKDKTPLASITLQSYVDVINQVIDEQSEPVILVAHSRGGIVISQVAEQRSEKIERLVYLASFLIPNGETVFQLAQNDHDSLIMQNLYLAEDNSWDMLKQTAFRDVLYADCDEDDISLANLLLTPEPIAPAVTPIQITDEKFGRVPRTYIELLQDKAVSLTLQRQMQERIPCETVISIEASHSAYFSCPDQLADALLSAI